MRLHWGFYASPIGERASFAFLYQLRALIVDLSIIVNVFVVGGAGDGIVVGGCGIVVGGCGIVVGGCGIVVGGCGNVLVFIVVVNAFFVVFIVFVGTNVFGGKIVAINSIFVKIVIRNNTPIELIVVEDQASVHGAQFYKVQTRL